MTLILTDTFTKSLEKLDGAEQKQVKVSVFDFQQNPDQPGASFHRIDQARDADMWSLRVNRDIRIVVRHHADDYVLCYVDHHDDAYRWAQDHEFRAHSATGAMQIVEVDERVEEVVRQIERDVEAPVFGRYKRTYLSQLGVPDAWLDAAHTVGESGLEALLEHLPAEATERLMKLYCGQPVPVPAANAPAGFVHPDAQRRFHLVDSQAALRLALEYPWERWTVFLHPDQREVVARDYSGPALVTGSAGTGKSVVAIHRAARLLGENPEARVLLTSYSRTLAIRLAQHMKCVLPPDDPSWQRLDVVNVHRLAADLWRNAHGSFQPVSDDGLNRYLEAAADRQSVTEFPRRFLRSEWDTIIDPWDVDSWERYRNIPRIGRGTPLGARQRFALWSVFDDVRQQLSAKSEMTWDGLCYRVAETLDDAPYEHVVADECQDLGPAELRLLQALAPADGVNNLFLTGDSGQQIYRRGFSWLAAGIDVRGRARRLRVNYRTTEQIRRFADALLADATREPNEDTEERASVSLLYGPPPDLYAASDPAEESEYLSAWLAELFTDGFEPQHVGIFARTKGILEERVAPALLRLGRATHTLSDDDPPSEGLVSVGTMHRAKGLEFRAVAVVGCDAAVLPLSFALKSVGDAGDLDEIVAQERHLLYVACTRAQRRLLVSWAGKPSAFLDIDVVHVGAPEPAPSRDQEEGTQDD